MFLEIVCYYRSSIALETYHLRMPLHVFSELMHLAFCSVQYMKRSTFLNKKGKRRQPMVPFFPNQLLVILLKTNKFFLVGSNSFNFPGVEAKQGLSEIYLFRNNLFL